MFNTKNGGCPLIRACSLIRSHIIYIYSIHIYTLDAIHSTQVLYIMLSGHGCSSTVGHQMAYIPQISVNLVRGEQTTHKYFVRHDKMLQLPSVANRCATQRSQCNTTIVSGYPRKFWQVRCRNMARWSMKTIRIFQDYYHRRPLHGLLFRRTATLDLTENIGCSECFRFRYVTNVNHCIVPKALIVPRSKSMRSRPDNGKNVRRKRHSVP